MGFPSAWADIAAAKGLVADDAPPLDCDEKTFQAAVVKLAKRHGWKVYHTLISKGSNEGFPDLICVRDRVVAIELKAEKGTATDSQIEWIVRFRQAGAESFIARPSDWKRIRDVLG